MTRRFFRSLTLVGLVLIAGGAHAQTLVITAYQQLAGAGLTLTSTGTRALDDVYAIDPPAQQKIASIAIYILRERSPKVSMAARDLAQVDRLGRRTRSTGYLREFLVVGLRLTHYRNDSSIDSKTNATILPAIWRFTCRVEAAAGSCLAQATRPDLATPLLRHC